MLSFRQALSFGFSRLSYVLSDYRYKSFFNSITFSSPIKDLFSESYSLISSYERRLQLCISSPWERLVAIPSLVNVCRRPLKSHFSQRTISLIKFWNSLALQAFVLSIVVDHTDLSISFEHLKTEAALCDILLLSNHDLKFNQDPLLSSLSRSSIDYMFALKSVAYLGSTRSTFSNLIALDSFLYSSPHSDYVMNLSLNNPVLRTDHGV